MPNLQLPRVFNLTLNTDMALTNVLYHVITVNWSYLNIHESIISTSGSSGPQSSPPNMGRGCVQLRDRV